MILVLNIMDGTIVNIAVPSIQRGLGTGYATIQWVIAGYSLAFALLLVTGGRLGDVIGYRLMFLFGVAGFTITSVFCGLAWSPLSLIAARVLQGAMAAMMAPQGASLIQVMYKPYERTVVMALFGTVGGLAAVLGPILGGALIQANLFGLDWRPIFLINFPIGLLAFAGGLFLLPAGKSPHPLQPDGLGTLLLVVALFLVVFPLVEGRDLGWPIWIFAAMIFSVPLFIGFTKYTIWKSARDGSALIAPELFHEPVFVIGIILNLVFASAVAGYLLAYTLMMQMGLGYSPIKTALTSIPFAAAVGFSIAVISRKAAMQLGRYLVTLGAFVMAIGLAGMLMTVRLAASNLAEPWLLFPSLLLGGLGMGMVTGPLSTIILYNVDVRHAGAASGVLNSIQQLGAALGVAIGGTIFFGMLERAGINPGLPSFAAAFEVSLAFQIVLLAGVVALSLVLPNIKGFMRAA